MCKIGGLILLRQNEVAAKWGQLCAMALSKAVVSNKPLIPDSQNQGNRDEEGHTTVPANNHGDIAARGFWKRDTTAIFDIYITDTDALSYQDQNPQKVLATQERAKKKKHLNTCLAVWKEFTPLVFSPDGLRGAKADAACKRVAALLASRLSKPYSTVCGYVRSRLAFALVWAVSLCL